MTRQQRHSVADRCFTRGTLLDRARFAADRALRCGALQPIRTESAYLDDRGIRFLVRTVAALRRKPRAIPGHNPFLPFEPDLHVADVSPTHTCILNKYNVVDLHLLIITRHFEPQESPLGLADFQALWRCLSEFDSLGFYNSGAQSGASQPHKHLQVVPLPLTDGANGCGVPLEPLLMAGGERPWGVSELDALPFSHAVTFWPAMDWDDVDAVARQAWQSYQEMLRYLNMAPVGAPSDRVPRSYNLLATRRWMLVIPRVAERFQTVSLNSLAFAGAMLVRAASQFEQLRDAGPFTALETVAAPKIRRDES